MQRLLAWWHPCADGGAGCLELDVPPTGPYTPPRIEEAMVTRSAAGKPELFIVAVALDATQTRDEIRVHDMSTGAPVAVWRDQEPAGTPLCVQDALLGYARSLKSSIGIVATNDFKVAYGSPSTVMTAPVYRRILDMSKLPARADHSSDRVLAMTWQLAGVVLRNELGS